MRIDGYLTLFEGDPTKATIKGETTDQVFGQTIEINGFDCGSGGSESEELLNPGEGAVKKVKAQYAKFGFKIDKEVDRASPFLFQAYCLTISKNIVAKKNYFPHARVSFRHSGQMDAVEYAVYEFLGVIVTSYSLNCSSDGKAKESVSFRFKGCMMEYVLQTGVGGGGAKRELMGWDYRANTRL